jgi:hypothetical protein
MLTMTHPTPIDEREIDARIAELMGFPPLEVIRPAIGTWPECRGWRSNPPLDWVSEEHERIAALRPGSDDRIRYWEPMPYSTDIAAAYTVETRIAELGLQEEYMAALWDIVGEATNYDDAKGRFMYKHASPEQICLAALKAVEVKTDA